MSAAQAISDPLAVEVAQYTEDPLGYVLDMFPWGVKGTELAAYDGPDTWQIDALRDLGEEVRKRRFNPLDPSPVEPIRMAIASGHGIGKGVWVAMVACWIMDTRPNSQGTITANTFAQLSSKTWPTVCKWRALSYTASWWHVGAESIYHLSSKDKFGVPQWFLKCQSSDETNVEAFAGQHAASSTSYYILDEASGIHQAIWMKADGGLTDGEPMIFATGNPTRNTGEFYEVCFGNKRHRWNTRSIDSRTCKFPNKSEIQRWIEDYGIDSDRVRHMVLGLPPHTSEDQLIGRDLVDGAAIRDIAPPLDDEPLIAGVDVPDGGSAWFIVRFRRGHDSRPGPRVPHPIRMAGARVDRPTMIAKLAAVMSDERPSHKVAAMFVDSAFGSPLCERLHTLGYDNVVEINFGGKSPDPHFANMRAFMWAKQVKEWLGKGAIDPEDKKLQIDLVGPGFHFNKSNAIVVESKEEMRKRGVPSPDDGDALALTFAQPVAAGQREYDDYRPGDKYGAHGWLR